MPAQDPAKALAKELSSLRREVSGLSRGSQMRYRSIDGGGIPVYDDSGERRGTIGILPDGTTGFQTVNDPPPPTPSAPILEPAVGGLQVTWDGTFQGAAPLPGDFRRVEIHASPYSVYTPTEATHRVDLIAPGTVVIALPPDPYTVIFVAVTTGGSRSQPSLSATETPEIAPSPAEIQQAREDAANAASAAQAAQTAAEAADAKAVQAAGLVAGKGTVYYGTTAPAGDPNGLWIDQTGGKNTPKRWNGTDWVAVSDAAIQAAADAAAAAHDAADAAQLQADSALSTAQTASAKADSALLKSEAAQTTADGKNRVFWRASGNPPPPPVIEGDLWFLTDQENKPRKYASGEWVDATFGDAAISGLNVGKLVAGQIAAGQRIIAGPTDGAHAEMNSEGFSTFAIDAQSGQVYEATQMGGPGGDRLSGSGPDGQNVYSVDELGQATFQGLSVAGDPTLNGRKLSDWLAGLPGGIVASSWGDLSYGRINARYGIGEVSWINRAGRDYRVTVHFPHIYGDTAGTRALLSLRATTDGTAPTINSPVVDSAFYRIPAGADYVVTPPDLIAHGVFSTVEGAKVRLLATVEVFDGGGTVAVGTLSGAFYRPFRMFVEDLGASVSSTYIANNGGGQLVGGPPPGPPPASKTTYTVQWDASWSRSFKWDGALRNDTTDLYQGYGDSFNRRNASLVGFPDLAPWISGSEINRVDVYLYAEHWWYASGGTAQIGLHGLLSPPGTAGSHSWGAVGQYHFARGEGAWFTLPSHLWAGWVTGAYRGLTFNAPSDDALYYGRFSGAGKGTHPIIRITYTK